jgi:hypothetical protein
VMSAQQMLTAGPAQQHKTVRLTLCGLFAGQTCTGGASSANTGDSTSVASRRPAATAARCRTPPMVYCCFCVQSLGPG